MTEPTGRLGHDEVMSQTVDSGAQWPLPRGLIVLLGAAAASLTIGGVRAASEIIGPIFLALVLTVAVHPLRGYLVDSHRWPTWAGTLAAILAAYVVLVAVLAALVYSAAKFAGLLPLYKEDLHQLVTSITDAWSRAGLPQQQADAVTRSLDPERLITTLTAIFTGLAGTASSLFFLFVLLLFMAIDAGQLPAKLAAAREGRVAVVSGLEAFAHGTRLYLVVATVFGFVVAVLDTAFLSFTPIPDPLLWGLLAFITNYIPNIGFVVGPGPAGGPGAVRGRSRPDADGDRRLLGPQRDHPVGDPAQGGGGRRRAVGHGHLRLAAVLGLGPRCGGRAVRGPADPARQVPADRRRRPGLLGRSAAGRRTRLVPGDRRS